MSNIKLIGAISLNAVVGVENNQQYQEIPWHYSSDMKFFREMTLNSTIIMGRRTFDTIKKPLSNRNNIVITSNPKLTNSENLLYLNSLKSALNLDTGGVKWVIGGGSIYQQTLDHYSVDEIYLTIIPQLVDEKAHQKVIRFPFINPLEYSVRDIFTIDAANNLKVVKYTKT